MSPSTAVFKLTRPGSLTRRLNFATQPSWSVLSVRISTLFDIPFADVGVSYIDPDGDEVTLSSEEELQEFYSTLNQGDKEPIKFFVQDLSALRSNPSHSRAPSVTPQRNTFGGNETLPMMFEVDDEWQRLPETTGSPFWPQRDRNSPHAFVEVLGSEIDTKSQVDDRDLRGEPFVDHHSSTSTAEEDSKGKQRASLRPSVLDDVESTNSLLESRTPAKPPIHVFDMSDTEDLYQDAPTGQQITVELPEALNTTDSLHFDITDKAESVNTSPAQDADPPVPTIDASQTPSAPSLFSDLEAFLTSASSVLSSHPELSEGFRNILTNASNGTYWSNHREALYRAGEHIQRTAAAETGRTVEELRRATEQQAGARVAEALDKIFRSFGERTTGTRGPPEEATSSGRPLAETPAPAPAAEESMHRMNASGIPPSYGPGVPPPFAAPFTAPPPPPPTFIPGQGLPPGVPPMGPFHWSRGGPPHPPPIPPIPPFARPFEDLSSVPEGFRRRAANIMNRYSWAGPMEWVPPRPPAPPAPGVATAGSIAVPAAPGVPSDSEHAPVMDQARADVEAAKAEYKAKKNAYRQMKAEKRKNPDSKLEEYPQSREEISVETKVGSANTGRTTTPQAMSATTPTVVTTPVGHTPATPSRNLPSPAVMVSSARGVWPGYEMISVPRRNHTIGHASARSARSFESPEARSMNRITRKLADMGFTESAHPDLKARVKKHMPAEGAPAKDAEDDIVTNLIEELLGASPNPRASTSTLPRASTLGNESLPGAWN
ncbi:hypothetical protein CONPUDRAFT_79208 [Coniophora puteana RWD-64-598 SS2]|uniref:PB1 domain-containing protein n=1 Tax=Coniophora puteana (strain RWD-64-598) TaxID=741705 RepID=A0A5M3N7F4_CONPW|nr:uncharacterized protein CONPUDRAFT_79208 [Coniophora puteana RWD-64-598 SS2]EIW87024.1 hypothetical protein CONPUDRAFT_79208 [Coniophora puteana RWD-64-598 SS2]